MTNFRYNHKATIYLLNWCIPGFFSHSQPLSKGVFGKQVLKALTHSIPLLSGWLYTKNPEIHQ